ncbi:transcriptional regulator, TraR/DksA family [Oceanospirillum multiglobuliferum]|uniref:Zinc finger DksA/TraR C4-type domain-containing protein n=1 Tax=Oceanospirillum multiglobuliferum TaxID=64969 RepID=A0A1T4QYB5_9GAMM|nr:TraR/DksA C4-type zinc finger protein [Oceanospirillum multiglobuliferum]OPX57058.1 hypothetical protein BTE48_01105 [Oceanospirillum multiglobuliferum]SKA08792.1 transcriptional regulator, TraR/DksA family [Oceanospirillum multiglobuliferum]
MTDILDKAQALECQQRDWALAQHERRKAEPAQKRIQGQVLCLACGEPVGYARLQAKPNAAYCIDCQSLRERGKC